jgi:excisionase family DNA binding protein
MGLSKEELHRLVDAIPEEEDPAVKRFLQFVIAASSFGRELTAGEAARRLGMRERQFRQWLREGRIPARKQGNRWWIREKELADYADLGARAFLRAPLSREQLSDEERRRSDKGWQDYLDGKALTLRDAEQRKPAVPG